MWYNIPTQLKKGGYNVGERSGRKLQPRKSRWFPGGGSRDQPREDLAVSYDRELNLKGKICPCTFVESMLALEEMENGQVLRIIVDYPPAACDVPQSLKGEGYEILEVMKINATDWSISVRNRSL